ncbi:hypothetical protein CQW23_33525 [Capsicum baccatum]|uniref:Protein TAR1 n=1 Tax=Capsicum baccatum TaxID=33114 RepID=A0A2G2V1M8_CAPBA|nr:hypothetical protein CQW23_33525 [Capsicum baccatum]
MRAAPGACPESSIQYSPLARRHCLVRCLAPAAPSWTTPPITDTSNGVHASLEKQEANSGEVISQRLVGIFKDGCTNLLWRRAARWLDWMGRDGPERQRAESQWIVPARPLYHLQYPVAYLSRLQRILPAVRWKLYFNCTLRGPPRPFRRDGLANDTCPWGPRPLLRVGKQTAGTCIACSPDSDLEAFSHNAAHGSFAPLSFQPSAMTNCVNQRRIPLVRTNFELAVQRAGSISSSPPTAYVFGIYAATRSRRGSSSSSPPTADGFGTGTPVPSPQSQSFSRSYGSILPTSLAYIVPSTRGCSPWRPDAVMSTTGRGRHSVLRIFKGRRERTGHHATCGALPAAGPYLRLSRFQGWQAVKQKRKLFPRLPPTSPDFLTLPSTATSRHSSPSFGSRQVCSHSNPSQKIKVCRWCTPQGDPTNQLRCALRVYSPVDSHICQTPWSVFEDESNGEPTGQRSERADAEACQRRALPARIEETAFHERIKSPGFGHPPNPHCYKGHRRLALTSHACCHAPTLHVNMATERICQLPTVALKCLQHLYAPYICLNKNPSDRSRHDFARESYQTYAEPNCTF